MLWNNVRERRGFFRRIGRTARRAMMLATTVIAVAWTVDWWGSGSDDVGGAADGTFDDNFPVSVKADSFSVNGEAVPFSPAATFVVNAAVGLAVSFSDPILRSLVGQTSFVTNVDLQDEKGQPTSFATVAQTRDLISLVQTVSTPGLEGEERLYRASTQGNRMFASCVGGPNGNPIAVQLSVYNSTDPFNIQHLAYSRTDGIYFWQGLPGTQYAVGTSVQGLQLLHHNTTHITLLGNITAVRANNFYIDGSIVYVMEGTASVGGGVRVLDCSNPLVVTQLDYLALGSTSNYPLGRPSLDEMGRLIVPGSGSPSFLVDVSNPSSLTDLKLTSSTGGVPQASYFQAVGDRIYVAPTTDSTRLSIAKYYPPTIDNHNRVLDTNNTDDNAGDFYVTKDFQFFYYARRQPGLFLRDHSDFNHIRDVANYIEFSNPGNQFVRTGTKRLHVPDDTTLKTLAIGGEWQVTLASTALSNLTDLYWTVTLSNQTVIRYPAKFRINQSPVVGQLISPQVDLSFGQQKALVVSNDASDADSALRPMSFPADIVTNGEVGRVPEGVTFTQQARFIAQFGTANSHIRCMEQRGQYVFICNYSRGFRVLKMMESSFEEIYTYASASMNAYAAEFTTNHAYVVGTHGGLFIFDIRDPENVQFLKNVASNFGAGESAIGISVSEARQLAILSFTDQNTAPYDHIGQLYLNLSNISAPTVIRADLGTDPGHRNNGWFFDNGRYMMQRGGYFLYLRNITNVTHPGLLAQYVRPQANTPREINGYWFIRGRSNEGEERSTFVYEVTIGNPPQLTKLKTYDFPMVDYTLCNQTLYVSTGQTFVDVYYARDLLDLQLIESIGVGVQVGAVTCDAGSIIVAVGSSPGPYAIRSYRANPDWTMTFSANNQEHLRQDVQIQRCDIHGACSNSLPTVFVQNNRPPIQQFSLPVISVLVGQRLDVSLPSALVTDPDNDPLLVSLVTTAPVHFNGDIKRLSTEQAFTSQQAGTYPLRFIYDDGYLGQIQVNGTLIVNRPPERNSSFISPPSAVVVGEAMEIALDSLFYDPDLQQALILSVEFAPFFPWVSYNQTTQSIRFAPVLGDQGETIVTVRADDPYRGSAEYSFAMKANQDPRILRPNLQVEAYVSDRLRYPLPEDLVVDVDGAVQWALYWINPVTQQTEDLSHSYFRFLANTNELIIRGNEAINATMRGRHQLLAIFTDNDGASGHINVTLNIPNRPPVVKQAIGQVLAEIAAIKPWDEHLPSDFLFPIPHDAIEDLDGDPLTTSVFVKGKKGLPAGIYYNPGERILFGEPDVSLRFELNQRLVYKACDELNCAQIEFDLKLGTKNYDASITFYGLLAVALNALHYIVPLWRKIQVGRYSREIQKIEDQDYRDMLRCFAPNIWKHFSNTGTCFLDAKTSSTDSLRNMYTGELTGESVRRLSNWSKFCDKIIKDMKQQAVIKSQRRDIFLARAYFRNMQEGAASIFSEQPVLDVVAEILEYLSTQSRTYCNHKGKDKAGIRRINKLDISKHVRLALDLQQILSMIVRVRAKRCYEMPKEIFDNWFSKLNEIIGNLRSPSEFKSQQKDVWIQLSSHLVYCRALVLLLSHDRGQQPFWLYLLLVAEAFPLVGGVVGYILAKQYLPQQWTVDLMQFNLQCAQVKQQLSQTEGVQEEKEEKTQQAPEVKEKEEKSKRADEMEEKKKPVGKNPLKAPAINNRVADLVKDCPKHTDWVYMTQVLRQIKGLRTEYKLSPEEVKSLKGAVKKIKGKATDRCGLPHKAVRCGCKFFSSQESSWVHHAADHSTRSVSSSSSQLQLR